ncbi:hypothetical protein B5C34_01425 [Pacificimonas flava]|uniref:M23ase beta-sheet core domain-containing protein n=2 Tax=Pacificimonas TaxID=1960290 RepID=A0A219B9T6_9SPHN|nr:MULTISPECIES: M23 family metallopeptidase [Pacificimonas]MBZ6378123.1 M23 family metallopeptidase [Pacificimonas aurantium]OWV34579.1 hypothetical protein B5C34_01425 [Pacificimonas flava]
MRTLGTILATTLVTALATSAGWIFLYERTPDTGGPAVTVPELVDDSPADPLPPREIPVPVPEEMLVEPSSPALAQLMGKDLVIPVQGFPADELRPQFQDDRGGRQHRAIDLPAPQGTPVLAAEDGVIEKFYDSDRGGITIYQFDPTETYVYYYAHLDSRADGLAEGDSVRRGQVIGYVGSTGNADGDEPHLHFAIERLGPEKRWWQATPIDPYPVLSAN